MSDFLSQDDIDALLQAGAGGFDDAGSGGGSGAFDAIIADFNDQQSSVLNTLIGRSISISVDEVVSDGGDLTDKIGGDYLTVNMTLDGGVSGTLAVHGLKENMAKLADLMVMGDGSAPYNAEEHQDAVKELYSAVNGGYSTFLGGADKVGESVNSTDIVVEDNTGASAIAGSAAVLTFSIENLDPFSMVLSYSSGLLSALEGTYGGGTSSSDSDGGFDFGDTLLSQDEMDSLTTAAEEMYDSGSADPYAMANTQPSPAESSFSSSVPKTNVDMLLDIDLDVSIELGRTDISIKRVLELAPGSLVELDSFAGEPVDLLVNNKVVAKGEVVVVDENFGVRIISLVSPEERIKSLR